MGQKISRDKYPAVFYIQEVVLMQVSSQVTEISFVIEVDGEEVYKYDYNWHPQELPLLPGEAYSIGATHFWRGFIRSEARISFPLQCQLKVYVNGKKDAGVKSRILTIHSFEDYVIKIAIELLMLGSTLEEVCREYNLKRPYTKRTKMKLLFMQLWIACIASAAVCYLTKLYELGLGLSLCSLVFYLAYKYTNKK